MTDTDSKKLEIWLADHMGEYIVKRAEAHRYFDAYPDKAEKIPRKLYEYDEDPRWLYEALMALTSMLQYRTDPLVAKLRVARETEMIPVILNLESKVRERIDAITILKKEQQ